MTVRAKRPSTDANVRPVRCLRRDAKLAKRLLVFDTETTGLLLHPSAPLEKQPHIIEFGAAVLERGEIVETVSWLINPDQPLSQEITEITGLTDADLICAPSFKAWLPKLRELFASCGGMMAHNLPFDRGMLHNDLRRVGAEKTFPWPPRGWCTVGLHRDAWGRNPKLKELYEDVMGKPLAQTHRALDDVRALVEIIRKEELWKLLKA